jgi:nucleoside-diphosphate-sugar epimerase
MKLLITGGAGFVGARLARNLLDRGTLGGRAIDKMVLADQAPPRPELCADARVEARTGPLLEQCAALKDERFDAVFHLASAVSGECELDFELGLRSNLDTTRALLDGLRAAGNVPRIVFSSSVAVFGPDPAVPLPGIVADDTLPTPQTSYGTHKLICEYLIADYTRKGYIDGRAARLMTVTVRPGRPNAAASSFFSGIIREPLAGEEAICRVDRRLRGGPRRFPRPHRAEPAGAQRHRAADARCARAGGRAPGARTRALRARRAHRRHRRQLAAWRIGGTRCSPRPGTGA